MAHILHEAINVPEAGIGGHPSPSAPAPTQVIQGEPNFIDGSGPIFSMYLQMAGEEDKKMVEGWKADADGMLIFTGLFSAAVASLISVSIQDIRPNPQDTSNFYLANIYQVIADPNRPNVSPPSPPPFSPPNYAVWVNALWFMSLVISISCALLATLLQQWARRYLRVTQPRYSPHKRARIRAFFFEGVEKFFLPWSVEAMPTLLHASLFLFFAGLVVFLCNANFTLFKLVLSWVGVCTTLYGCITLVPIFRHDSPYHTPLSLPVWHIVIGISFVTFRALRRLTELNFFSHEAYNRFRDLEKSYRKFLVQGMQKTAEEAARNSPSEIDTRAFLWTFDSLDEDHELERFFAGLPGLRSSKVVDDPLPRLTEGQKENLSMALMGLLDRTFSSDLLPEPVKNRRATVCAKALDPAEFPDAYGDVLYKTLFRDQYRGLQTARFGLILRGWSGSSGNEDTALLAQAVAFYILVRAQWRDDSWFILASSELGIPESVLRDHAAHGDSLSLAILIHVVLQQFGHYQKRSWLLYAFSKVLETATNFNVQDTSPELQHEFCALWNRITLKAQNDNNWTIAEYILKPIRTIYLALHQYTDSAPTCFSISTGNWDDVLSDPTSYPMCDVTDHIQHGHSSSATYARIVALVPSSLPSPDAPSPPVPVPVHVTENPMDVSPLDNSQPAHQTETVTECVRIPETLATASDVFASGITISHPTPETSTSAPPLSYTFPPAAVILQHNADLPTHSGTSNLPSLAPSNLVPDNILPTCPPLSSHLPTTRSDFLPSCPESHCSRIVTTSPGASPAPTSSPEPGATAERDGSPKPELRKGMAALDPPSVNHSIRANSVATLDISPQFPSPPYVTDSDIAIAGSSLREPNADRTRDCPPHPSHCLYDMV